MGARTMLTVEEFERLPQTAEVCYELDQGELVEMARPGYPHNRIRGRTERLLGNHLDAHPEQGAVVAEQYFRISKDTLYGPDVAVIGPDQMPLITPNSPPFSPALAIEITSPSNTFHELARKIKSYLDAGSKAVWIFDTDMREIKVYRAGARPKILSGDDLLEDAELLPGFSVRVEDLFKE